MRFVLVLRNFFEIANSNRKKFWARTSQPHSYRRRPSHHLPRSHFHSYIFEKSHQPLKPITYHGHGEHASDWIVGGHLGIKSTYVYTTNGRQFGNTSMKFSRFSLSLFYCIMLFNIILTSFSNIHSQASKELSSCLPRRLQNGA